MLKKGNKVKCLRTHNEDGSYSIFLREGEKYYVSEIDSFGIYVENMWYDYIGYYPLEFFFTTKQIRKMKLYNIKS